ncbi:DNA-directed RNA polymerase subunit alpha [Mycoplasma flocculare]|uniref:DNA-directed RNA polymerase subunit alpha n=2 Tax=Mesomycoplasma flocculare TaxID=2128 RepID=A0A0A8E7L3_MESFC|nr:DNA-directed RNA polymerase subunit alpha [Mesomycoplasma flocculare]MXR39445.1 DNA-directed RNA polymerase subunit alpha [Mycoplasma sp. MF12]AJC49974.1 DNA-directed RNA polymerase subunit alpha [Mesomycoplasma flocculare ATCC 27399]ENX50943.1 DNA-directed RNA polymerase alpha subunit [Mesomycoplasma flocculare ATCC 27716]MXR05854.1 DNA-directed RNA polymerase subunit alpha [Mesomycoplasma flocculare]MXR12266.1 DNA-directed RNA polymerase subunit alpha [Mesomycoplasma flocculare]
MKKNAKVFYSENIVEQITEFETSFELKPLERGLANTIGNALRRTVLSAIPSCAVFAVKIAGVKHEFAVLDDVIEDVVTILNNLKKVRFFYEPSFFEKNQIHKASFSGQKAGQIFAGDIQSHSGLKIVNPDLYIADISRIGALQFEIFITSGKGFSDFETNKKYVNEVIQTLESNLEGTVLAVDSDFSPVLNANYQSIEINSASPIIEEKLNFWIKTDGSILAKDVLAQGAKILIAHLNLLANVENLNKFSEDFFENQQIKEEPVRRFSNSIDALNLSVRSLNALRRAQYYKISDIENLSQEDFENIKNLGRKSVQEIIEKLQNYKHDYKGEN